MYGGLTLVSCQMCTQLLSHSLSSAEQEQKMVEKLEGWDKEREHLLPSWAKQIQLREDCFNFLQMKIDLDSWKQRQSLNHVSLAPSTGFLCHCFLFTLFPRSSRDISHGWSFPRDVSTCFTVVSFVDYSVDICCSHHSVFWLQGSTCSSMISLRVAGGICALAPRAPLHPPTSLI